MPLEKCEAPILVPETASKSGSVEKQRCFTNTMMVKPLRIGYKLKKKKESEEINRLGAAQEYTETWL
jgi:hypothetical protein